MAYADYYGNCIENALDPHACQNACAEELEHANISTGAWIHKSAYAAIVAAPTTQAVWDAAITAGTVIMLPDLRGSFDGGTSKIGSGFGRSKGTYQGKDFKITLNDRVYQANWAHYRSLVGVTGWHLLYVTETQGHITGVPVTIDPKAVISENVDDVILWTTDATWFEFFTPAPFTMPPAVIDCGYVPA